MVFPKNPDVNTPKMNNLYVIDHRLHLQLMKSALDVFLSGKVLQIILA